MCNQACLPCGNKVLTSTGLIHKRRELGCYLKSFGFCCSHDQTTTLSWFCPSNCRRASSCLVLDKCVQLLWDGPQLTCEHMVRIPSDFVLNSCLDQECKDKKVSPVALCPQSIPSNLQFRSKACISTDRDPVRSKLESWVC